MNPYLVVISIFLISLTNLIMFQINGLAPITLFMLFAPVLIIVVVANACILHSKIKNSLSYIIIIYFLMVSVLNFDQTRWSSLAYSMFYFSYFFVIINSIASKEQLSSVSKLIIGAYFVNVSAAQFFFFSFGNISSLNWLLQGQQEINTGMMRFYGFSSEPSYAAFVVVVALIVYFRFNKDRLQIKLLVLCSAIYLILSFSSVYGLLLMVAFGLSWILEHKLIKPSGLITIVIVSVFSYLSASFLMSVPWATRTARLIDFLISGSWDLDSLRMIDSSAFMRIGPTISYLNEIDFFSFHAYFGFGPGNAANHFGNVFNDAIGIGQKGYQSGTINLGILPSFLYDYGIIGFTLILVLVIRRSISRLISLESFVFLMLILNANLNTQLFWYVWAMFFLMNTHGNFSDSPFLFKKIRPKVYLYEKIKTIR